MLSEKEKQALRQKIQSNKHEIYVVSMEEMDAIIKSSPKGTKPGVQAAWQKIRDKAGLSASYYASADDAVTMAKLVGDLGGIGTRAYIKNYGGKPHIILKGHAGLRKILTGTKYGIKNPKVVTMGLGKAGAVNAAKSGGILTVVLLSAYRVADYFLTDQTTLSQLIGTLATDVVKVGIATGASIATASAVVAMGFTIAIGPIAAVILVGIATSMILGDLDESYGITDRVIAGLDSISETMENRIEGVKQNFYRQANDLTDSVIDYVIDSARVVFINTAKHTLDKFLSGRPRLR